MRWPKWKAPTWWRSLLTKLYLRYLALGSRPILLGPFRTELGFEVLYWEPFLRWAVAYAKIPPERCVAVSRGGMGAFYPATRQVDLYTLSGGIDAVRIENALTRERTAMVKQMRVTPWDRLALKDAAGALGIRRFKVLHPSWMYWLFEPWWEERASASHIGRHTVFKPLTVPTLPTDFKLPENFVAVKVYERHTLPFNDQVKAMCAEMVQRIAAVQPVVLLHQDGYFDDHTDLPLVGPNIYVLPKVAPEQNLILQAAVLARAQAFVGTYGGVAQWALRYGRPSISLYWHFGGTAQAHRDLSLRLSASSGVPFDVHDLKLSPLWRMACTPVEEKEGAVA